MAYYITGVTKESGQEITGYQLDNGQIVSKSEGIAMAKQGLIEYVTVNTSKTGEEYLRSVPDEYSNNNLGNLPVVNLENQIQELPIANDADNAMKF